MGDEANSANADSETAQPSAQENTEQNKTQEGSNGSEHSEGTDKSKEESNSQPQDQDWKKRYDGTAKSLKEKSEQYDRAIQAQSALAQNNPDYLEELAKTDKTMADEVSQKIYGKGYDDYQASQKIKELRETDPESANREERLRSLELKEQTRQREVKAKYLAAKGLNENKFDPEFQKFENQLDVLDKKFVENNYDRALEMAYNLAFPEKYSKEDMEKAQKDAILAKETNKSGGAVATESASSKPQMTGEAKSFNSKFKELLQPDIIN